MLFFGLSRRTNRKLAAQFDRSIRQTVKHWGVQKGTRILRQRKMRDAVSKEYQSIALDRLQKARVYKLKRLEREAENANAAFVEFTQKTDKKGFVKNLELHRKALAYKRKRKAYLETVLGFAKSGFVIAPREKLEEELKTIKADIVKMERAISETKPKAIEQKQKYRRLKEGERLISLMDTNAKERTAWIASGKSTKDPEYLKLLEEMKKLVEKAERR